MMKRTKTVGLTILMIGAFVAILNNLLWARSYTYACWRVTHPFGPNVNAFAQVINKTQPRDIPVLISELDKPDKWWIESMFRAWFPEAQPPATGKRDYWNQWWTDHRMEYESSLVLQHDPQF